jgi:hypothetical protein
MEACFCCQEIEATWKNLLENKLFQISKQIVQIIFINVSFINIAWNLNDFFFFFVYILRLVECEIMDKELWL